MGERWIEVGRAGVGAAIGLLGLMGMPAMAADVVTPAGAATAGALELVCYGRGAHNRATLGSAFAFGGNGNATAVGVGSQRVESGGQSIRVRIDGDNSAVRIPRELFGGKLHNSAPDGWLAVKDVVTTEKQINGRVNLFLTSHPRMRIDRDTGTIEIHGNNAFSFSGECEKAPVDAAPKF